MKTKMAWLLFGVLALIPFAETLSCYDCFIDNTHDLSDGNRTTCPEQLTPSSTSTCEGVVCLIIWSDYGSYGHTSNLTCLTNTLGYKVDDCLMLNSLPSQYKFYVYNDMCCVTSMSETSNKNGSSIQYNYTACGCDGDYCNGNATMPMFTVTTSNPTTITPITETNTISLGNWRHSDGYISGFALIVVNLISIMQNHFAT